MLPALLYHYHCDHHHIDNVIISNYDMYLLLGLIQFVSCQLVILLYLLSCCHGVPWIFFSSSRNSADSLSQLGTHKRAKAKREQCHSMLRAAQRKAAK